MKTIGITRYIDDLGRIAIPKEIRRMAKIREGDEFEIYITTEGEIALKKHSFMKKELDVLAKQICDAVFNSFGFSIAVTDKDDVIAASGAEKNSIIDRPVSPEMQQIMSKFRIDAADNTETIFLDVYNRYPVAEVMPIMRNNMCVGSVAIIGDKGTLSEADENERYMVVKMVTEFLKKYITSF